MIKKLSGNLFPHKLDLLALLIISLLAPLFFYKLGQSSLVSWDEAWYAAIARNILNDRDILHLTFNGGIYLDHPPLGFWLMAATLILGGSNEFWVRFPQAILGLGGLAGLYFLGKELFGRAVGLASAIALASSFWYVYRARSGNLDILLTVFFILSFLFAFKAVKDKKYLLPFSLSFSGLLLSKTLVPLTILPALTLLMWGNFKWGWKELKTPILILFVFVGGWFFVQWLSNPSFWSRYLMIGAPGVKTEAAYLENFKLVKEYLHSGVGKWFWPGIASPFLGSLLLDKRFLVLLAFCFSFLLPFIFSPKGHIWHLIPLHPFLILAFLGLFYTLMKKILSNEPVASGTVIIISVIVSLWQIRIMWYQFIDINPYISDEAILSQEAGKYKEEFYIDGGNFGPSAVWYSGKNVNKVWEGGLPELFEKSEKFILITHQWRLDKSGISPSKYRIIKTDRDKILVINN